MVIFIYLFIYFRGYKQLVSLNKGNYNKQFQARQFSTDKNTFFLTTLETK